jgi:uncharacterized membrane protein YuzA (DUF378 family)
MMNGDGKKNPIHMIAFCLLIIGGLNWLLVAFGWNLVDGIFGAGSGISMVIYILVGLSAIWELVMHKKQCKVCSGMMMHDKGSSGGGSTGGGSMNSGSMGDTKM